MDELHSLFTEDEAVERVNSVSLAARSGLNVLLRGTHPVLSTKSAQHVALEYPYLALAIVERDRPLHMDAENEKVRKAVREFDLLSNISVPFDIPGKTEYDDDNHDALDEAVITDADDFFQAGHIYPLLDPERYDDDEHAGYGYVLIDASAEPGRCYVHDAWVVNADGDRHPGIDACPVPIQLQDVDLTHGRPLTQGRGMSFR